MKFRLVNLSLFLLFLTACFSSSESLSITSDDVLYIYDGDTITIRCIGGYQCDAKGRIHVRVKGVDTAEMRGKCKSEIRLARKAKKFTVARIRNSRSIELVVNQKNVYDKYKRLLAEVIIDGEDLSQSLIDADLGRDYHGGYRDGWCD